MIFEFLFLKMEDELSDEIMTGNFDYVGAVEIFYRRHVSAFYWNDQLIGEIRCDWKKFAMFPKIFPMCTICATIAHSWFHNHSIIEQLMLYKKILDGGVR